ncbi:MAG: adenine deaminase [Betaproteobacteria bacterium]|nr:adenine deaminase [Betaproteobacteria bacterium]
MIESIPQSIRLRAIQAAQGKAPFDVLLAGGTVVDVATLELREADVGLVGEMIASVHPRGAYIDAVVTRDVSGQFIAPGFIDGHVHFESSHMLPHHYAQVVVPQGTTTIFCDPHELANVLGVDGMRWAVAASRNLPLRFIVQASSCVPAAPGLEMSGADFQAEEIRELLSWPEVAGLAEVMDMRAVLEASPRMVGILSEALASGKIIEGHARGLTGGALQAYLAAGISADHEITSGADALEKLRAGMTVEIRGSHDYLLPGVIEAINTLPVVPASLTVCTDDVFPDHLVEKGGVSDVIRRMIRYGMEPLQAYRCATINNALRLRRDDLGMVCAGRRADLAILGDLREVTVAEVYVGGRRVALNGALTAALTEALQPAQVKLPERSMKLERLSSDDFRVRVPGVHNGRAVLRTIRGARFNTWSELEVAVKEGFAVVPPQVSVMTVVHRHGRSDLGPQSAIIEGWDRWGGAYATSYSHDSHNLVVYGFDPQEMALAANTVIDMGGGDAVVKSGRVVAQVAFPVAGLLSPKPPAEVAREHRAVVEAAGTVVKWEGPYRTFKALSGQCLACNPGPHLTDQGLTDGETKKIFGNFLRAA